MLALNLDVEVTRGDVVESRHRVHAAAIGAATGGAMLTATGFGGLHWAGLGFMGMALALSLWLGRRMQHRVVHA